MRSLVASSPQRRGEEMDAAISTTLEPVPRPSACQGRHADGDGASEGPCRESQKAATVAPPLVAFRGPQRGPRLGAVCVFSVKDRDRKMDPIFVLFLYPKATAVWQWFHFLQGRVPPGRQVLRLNLDETSVRFWYEPRQGLRRPRGQVPRGGYARKASRALHAVAVRCLAACAS